MEGLITVKNIDIKMLIMKKWEKPDHKNVAYARRKTAGAGVTGNFVQTHNIGLATTFSIFLFLLCYFWIFIFIQFQSYS